MFLNSRVENPLASTRTLYDPAGRLGTVYPPLLPVRVSRVSLVEGFVTITFAPVTTAPLGSTTVPFKDAVGSWANKDVVSKNKIMQAGTLLRITLICVLSLSGLNLIFQRRK